MTLFEADAGVKLGHPLLSYELNEVPWRVVVWYVRRYLGSVLERLLSQANTLTTVTRDEGELHTWTTWPNRHRGVTNSVRNLRCIDQSLAEANA